MSYRIGIDPGASGAIVVMDAKFNLIEWSVMPTVKVGANTRVNGAELCALLEDFDTGHAYLELTGAMPGQGVTSMYSFGHANGVVSGVLAAMRITSTLVTPQAWKKRAGLIGTDCTSRCKPTRPSGPRGCTSRAC